MSEENVEIVRRIFDAWGAGDFSVGPDVFDSDVMFIVRSPFPESAVLVGPAAIRQYMSNFLPQFKPGSLTIKGERFRVAGDTVLIDVAQHGEGRFSGLEADFSYFMLVTLRGGTIVRIESIQDPMEALEAAGLSDSGA
ncbi:MAG: nuclear transport factor 2 family protein [Actinobacteria bacterium]|nr:nuclear transport factor 2 family protein [Actinomycetota bacterium]